MTRVLWSGTSQNKAKVYIEDNATSTDLASLNGALNDAFLGRGKDSGTHPVVNFGEQQILHASASKRGSGHSTTVFFFGDGDELNLIAVGQHDGKAYKIDDRLGQAEQPFQKGKKVSVTGK